MVDLIKQDPFLISTGVKIMAIDVQETLVMESVQAHQHIMNESKANIQSSNNLLRHVAVKKFDEADTIEAAAIEKVLQAGKSPS